RSVVDAVASQWERRDETRATFEDDVAVVSASDPAADREPEAAPRRIVALGEPLEEIRAHLARDAGAVVLDAQFRPTPVDAGHPDVDARARITDGIGDQIAREL